MSIPKSVIKRLNEVMARADRLAWSPYAYLTGEERNQKINSLLARVYSGLITAEKVQLLNDISLCRKSDSGAFQQLFSLKEELVCQYGKKIKNWPIEKRKEVLRLHIILMLARMSQVEAIGYLEGQGAGFQARAHADRRERGQ